MNLSLISKKFKEYPILFVCGVICPLVLVLLFMRGPKIEQYETELEELEREWSEIQTNKERSSGLEEDIASLEAGLEKIDKRLMQVEEVAINYEFFYDLEAEGNIELNRFSQGEASDGKQLSIGKNGLRHFSVLPYNLSMTGSMEEILGFMDLLDRQEYIVRMDMLWLSPVTETSAETPQLSGRLQCHVLAAKHE